MRQHLQDIRFAALAETDPELRAYILEEAKDVTPRALRVLRAQVRHELARADAAQIQAKQSRRTRRRCGSRSTRPA